MRIAPPLARRGRRVARMARWFGRKTRILGNIKIIAAVCFCASTSAMVFGAQGNRKPGPPLGLNYQLFLKRPTTHLMKVEITVRNVDEPSLDFVMPAWAPGRYAIYDFAKNVQQFSARGARGQTLSWSETDKETWKVITQGAGGKVEVDYRVFGNDLTGSFTQFDTTHAALNGASVFMYVAGHKPDPLTLTVHPPPDWKIYSGYSLDPDQQTFHVRDYDILVDTPLEISPDCTVDEFKEDGKTFRVAVHSYTGSSDPSREALVAGLKKIVAVEMAMMPAPGFKAYTFLFHFDPELVLGDGMEHLNSTDIIVSHPFDADGVEEALEIAAHEFFHVWNLKRLRPAGLGPFNYEREVYTPSLWFVEGVTQYYTYVNLYRSRLWTRAQFLAQLAEEIRTLRNEPGRRLMSAESSSFHAWFYDRSPQMQETNFANSTISYYNKGALLGMLLDLEIRERTGGRKSLDSVMRLMYRKFYESPATTYYGPGRGYTERDILNAVNEVSGADFSDFFKQYVAGTASLPYAEAFAGAGLKLAVSVQPGTPPSLGVMTRPTDLGLEITAVRPGGPADRAGLSRDDQLISVDQRSLATDTLSDRLGIYPPGAKVPFEVERHLQRKMIFVTLGPPRPNDYEIQDAPAATPAQIAIRKGWLSQ